MLHITPSSGAKANGLFHLGEFLPAAKGEVSA